MVGMGFLFIDRLTARKKMEMCHSVSIRLSNLFVFVLENLEQNKVLSN